MAYICVRESCYFGGEIKCFSMGWSFWVLVDVFLSLNYGWFFKIDLG